MSEEKCVDSNLGSRILELLFKPQNAAGFYDPDLNILWVEHPIAGFILKDVWKGSTSDYSCLETFRIVTIIFKKIHFLKSRKSARHVSFLKRTYTPQKRWDFSYHPEILLSIGKICIHQFRSLIIYVAVQTFWYPPSTVPLKAKLVWLPETSCWKDFFPI